MMGIFKLMMNLRTNQLGEPKTQEAVPTPMTNVVTASGTVR